MPDIVRFLFRANEFQGHGTFQNRILGQVDLSHSPLTQFSNDLIGFERFFVRLFNKGHFSYETVTSTGNRLNHARMLRIVAKSSP